MNKFNIPGEELIKLMPEDICISGNLNGLIISNFSTPDKADESSLIWISPDRDDCEVLIKNSSARVAIVSKNIDLKNSGDDKVLIYTSNPRLSYMRILNHYCKYKPEPGVHSSCIIHPEAAIGDETHIGPNCTVGIVSIGIGSILYGHNFIYDNVHSGKGLILQAGAILGAEGMGHIKNENGAFENYAHIGGVKIGDNVEIGVNSAIARGTLGDTIIGNDTKIDCFVQIGHNVRMGNHVMIASHSVVGGSTVIEDGVYIGLGAVISDGVTIGKNAHIGPSALITHDVEENSRYLSRSAFRFKIKERQ